MTGRDPQEAHRAATPLELLFDLTFATCFSLAASEFAQVLATGHFTAAILAFSFASFGICWAWINFSWFSSAYDTDDWIFRIATMVQMTGVLVFAIGLPRMFAAVDRGAPPDISVMVMGYIVMRTAMVFQWLRAFLQDSTRRRVCLTYAVSVSVAQVGWVALIFIPLTGMSSAVFILLLAAIELTGPYIAELWDGGTPWHPLHIAERYSLFAIIALGEGIVGTVATLTAVTGAQGWTLDAALVCVAGTGLTFGMWWTYYIEPSGPILHAHRERSFVWGYSQMAIIASIVATGAGLHVAAYYIEGRAHIGAVATVLCVAVPVCIFLAGIYALYYYLVRRFDRLHTWLLCGTAIAAAIAIAAALANVDMAICLVLLMLAPMVTVVGYETKGYRHQMSILAQDTEGAEVGDRMR